MRIIFKLEETKTKDLPALQQFDICVMATRMICTQVPISIQIPKGWQYPTTWRGLERLGVLITREAIAAQPGDILLKGDHIPIVPLNKVPLPCVPQYTVKPPETLATLEQSISWLDQHRQQQPLEQIWMHMPPTNTLFWNSPPKLQRLPIRLWLEWVYWMKPQPVQNPETRVFSYFKRKRKIIPPIRGM
jgi:hypothetical protein